MIRNAGAATPRAVAIADDGRVMATVRSKVAGVDEFGDHVFSTTLALVGIDDRWYRPVAVTGPNGRIAPEDVDMTPNAQRVVFAGGFIASPATAADGSSLVGTKGLFVYDGSTKKVSRPVQPDGARTPSISDDGRFVAMTSDDVVGVLDLVTGTYQSVGVEGYQPQISGDGRYVVWAAHPPDSGSQITRYDRTDGSTVTLPELGSDPSISRDGSRISARRNPSCCMPDRQQYIDVGDAAWTTVAEGPAGGENWLSSDGRRLVYGLGADTVSTTTYDADLTSGSIGDFGPRSFPQAVSPNGNHVLYWSPALGVIRWNR